MPESRAREVINVLKESLEETPAKTRKVPNPEPKKSKKTAVKAKNPSKR